MPLFLPCRGICVAAIKSRIDQMTDSCRANVNFHSHILLFFQSSCCGLHRKSWAEVRGKSCTVHEEEKGLEKSAELEYMLGHYGAIYLISLVEGDGLQIHIVKYMQRPHINIHTHIHGVR